MQKTITIAAILLLPAIILLSSFGILVYDKAFYTKLILHEHGQSGQHYTGFSEEIIDYLKNNKALDSKALSGEEIKHMGDVKKTITASTQLAAALVLIMVVLTALSRHKDRIFFYGGLLTIVLAILIAVLPFSNLFTLLHKLLFAEGSWQFPAGTLLVTVFSEGFFRSFALAIVLHSALFGLALCLLGKLSAPRSAASKNFCKQNQAN